MGQIREFGNKSVSKLVRDSIADGAIREFGNKLASKVVAS